MRRALRIAIGLFCLAAVGTLPAVAQSSCDAQPGQLGPCPALIDTNRNGVPEPGVDEEITFNYSAFTSGGMVTIDNPWTRNCGGYGNVVYFSQSTTGGPIDRANRFEGGRNQIVEVSDYNGFGEPVGFSYNEMFNETVGSVVGSAQLRDDNSDGAYEHLQAMRNGSAFFDVSFVGTSGFVSIPWAQADLVGMNGRCALPGGDPQIFIPTVGNRIVIGYPGFGQSPLLFVGPLQQGIPVPTVSEWGVILLLLTFGFVGWRILRRRHALA